MSIKIIMKTREPQHLEGLSKDTIERLMYIITNKFSTKKEFARLLDVSPTTVSGWTCGRIGPSVKVLTKIAVLTHTSLDWLLLGKTDTTDSLNETIFNQVFAEGYSLAQIYKLPLNGSYFLALYFLVMQELKNHPKSTPAEIIRKHKETIIRLRQ